MEDIKTRKTKLLELKNTMSKMKNIVDGLTIRFDTKEEKKMRCDHNSSPK